MAGLALIHELKDRDSNIFQGVTLLFAKFNAASFCMTSGEFEFKRSRRDLSHLDKIGVTAVRENKLPIGRNPMSRRQRHNSKND
jgi:hypothetical protein